MTDGPEVLVRRVGMFGRVVPASVWLGTYDWRWLRLDIAAGVTLAAYLLPAGLGDASLAGLPPQSGLYACLFSGLVFWMFCSSRQTAITVTSAISLLLGTTLGSLAGGDPTRFGSLAACTAVLVAALAFLAWVVRAGVIVNFISETVLVGFKTGVALILVSTQLPKLFGFKGGHGNFWENAWYFVTHVRETHLLSLSTGVCALVVLAIGKLYWKKVPVALVVVVGGVLVASLMSFGDRGVRLLGVVPQGLPSIGLHGVQWSDFNTLLPLAMACFLLGAVETVAIGRMFAQKSGVRIDPNQEFLSLAAANLAAGLGQGFAVSGGMSQSLVNDSAGAKTPLSGLFAAILMLIVIIFFSGLLQDLPQPVLAAIVLMAVTGLFKVEAFKKLWRFSRSEFAVAIVATMGVLGSGILKGVLIGAIMSILLLLRKVARPHVAVLGQVPGTDLYGDVERNPENIKTPGVVVVRVDAGMLYFNAEFIRERVLEILQSQPTEVKLAVWCLSSTPWIDLAGVETLEHIRRELADRGVRLELAEARGQVRERLNAEGLDTHFGETHENVTVASMFRRWLAAQDSSSGVTTDGSGMAPGGS